MRALILVPLLGLAACAPAPDQAPEQDLAQTQAQTARQDPQANIAAMPAWENAKDAGVQFRAVGQEPGWMLDIYAGARAMLLLDYGATLLDFALPYEFRPEIEQPIDANAYGQAIAITITHAPCEDAMSGQSYAYAVSVRVDERTLSGCGVLVFYRHPHAQGATPR